MNVGHLQHESVKIATESETKAQLEKKVVILSLNSLLGQRSHPS